MFVLLTHLVIEILILYSQPRHMGVARVRERTKPHLAKTITLRRSFMNSSNLAAAQIDV